MTAKSQPQTLQPERFYQIIGLVGALMWAGVQVVRWLGYALPAPLRFVLNVLPNFAAVWTAQGLFVFWYPQLMKKPASRKLRFLSLGAILLILLMVEWLHPLTGGSPFDPYDMLASLVAAVPLTLYNLRRPASL